MSNKLKYKQIKDKQGNLIYEGKTLYGKPYGEGKSFFSNGNIYQEGLFGIKGFRRGKEYYPNGKLRFEGVYRICGGYGPNFPVKGKCYDKDGNLFFEGETEYVFGGVGYPSIKVPKNYGPIVQDESPKIKVFSFEDEEKLIYSDEKIIDKRINKNQKEYPRGTLFEFYQDYTYMDEDYFNEIVIEENGQLVVSQRSTYMYEPTTISHIKFMDEDFAENIKAVIEKNKDSIDKLPNEQWSEDYSPYKIKIRDRKFELRFIKEDSSPAMLIIAFRILIDYYYPKLINWETIFYENHLRKSYDEVMEMAKRS